MSSDNIVQVPYGDRQAGDILIVKAPPGWAPPSGWTVIQLPSDSSTYAWRRVTNAYRDIHDVEVIAFRGVPEYEPGTGSPTPTIVGDQP